MRELDVVLTRYVNSVLTGPPETALRELPHIEQLLELQDPDLARYLLGNETPELATLAALVARIRSPVGLRSAD